MKILQIITLSELGGAQAVVVNLSNSLSKSHEVIVAAGDGDGKMFSMLNKDIKFVKIHHLKRSLSVFDDFLTYIELKMLYKKEKPDIIHLHSSKIGILGRLAFPKSKTIYTVHGFDSIRVAYRQYLPIERLLQKRCKAIVGVSRYDLKHLIEEGISKNVVCIHNGISRPNQLNKDPFSPYANYKYRILCIARLAPPKNSQLFMEIASLLPEYAFFWIGNKEEYTGEKPANVFFLGNLTNAGAYCEYVDIFLLTSNYEGLPIVVLEAMSFGKPVVASNVGGISEIVVNNENGFTIDNDAELFVQKIKYILDNQTVYTSFSERAQTKFEVNLTVGKMTEKYLELYN